MITVVLSIALTLAGLSLTVGHVGSVNSMVMGLLAEAGVGLSEQRAGWAALLASPLALAAGSLLRGL